MSFGFGFGGLAFAPNNYPAGLALSGWWRDVEAAAPGVLVAQPSLGASGSNVAVQGATPMQNSTPVNGRIPVRANGSNARLQCPTLATLGWSVSTYSGWLLAKCDANGEVCGTGSLNASIQISSVLGNSVRLTHFRSGGSDAITVAAAFGAHYLWQFRFTGGVLSFRKNADAWSTLSSIGNILSTAGQWLLGTYGTGTQSFADILECGMTPGVAITDPQYALILDYCRKRYALDLA